MQIETQKKTSIFLGKKKQLIFSLRVHIFYKRGNTKRITDDQHSPPSVITTETLSVDVADHTKDLKFFLFLLRHTAFYYYYYMYIELFYSCFSPQINTPSTDYAEKQGENKTRNRTIGIKPNRILLSLMFCAYGTTGRENILQTIVLLKTMMT